MKIYNLFPPLAGYFTDWGGHIQRAADLGFDWLFVNPVQAPGGSGSLYSIADYFTLNPRFVDPKSEQSGEQQLREAIRFAESQGLKVMVDLVINHCAADSELLQTHPDWFQRRSDGRVRHPSCDEDGKRVVWRDLASFDHRHTPDPEGLYGYLGEILSYLVGLGFQGFRCDAAYQLPSGLWKRLIGDAKQRHPQTLFLAETLGCTPEQTRKTAAAGFDYVYNSAKWWDYGSPWLMEQYNLVRETCDSIAFPESHDTERLFDEMQGSVEAMKQRYLFTALFSAGVMMPVGFEYGFRRRLHVTKTRPDDWESPAVDLSDFIRALNRIKQSYRVFQHDCPTEIIGHQNPAILILRKSSRKSPEEALIILNKDTSHHQNVYLERLEELVQSDAPLSDVSPEYGLDYLPAPFNYDLRPGQGFVLVARRNEA